jgi:hypothetical protein
MNIKRWRFMANRIREDRVNNVSRHGAAAADAFFENRSVRGLERDAGLAGGGRGVVVRATNESGTGGDRRRWR